MATDRETQEQLATIQVQLDSMDTRLEFAERRVRAIRNENFVSNFLGIDIGELGAVDTYLDWREVAVPDNPDAGFRRVFADTATNKLSVRTSGGVTINLEYGDSEAITAVEGEATLDLTGNVSIAAGKTLAVDVIGEKSADTGVTIDSVLLKDGLVDGIDVAARDHAKYLDSEAITAVEGEATLDLTGNVTIQDGTASKTLSILVTGDANPKMTLSKDRLEFGAGGASALDSIFKRSAAGIFELERASADIFLQGRVTSEGARRWSIDQTGINFGSGSAVEDVTFGRSTIGTLGVADWFAQDSGILAGTDQSDFVRLVAGVSSLALRLFTVTGSTKDANARARYAHDRIEFGAGGASALDVNLYRNAADELKTDDKFLVGAGLDVTGDIAVSGTVDGVDIATRDHAKYTDAEVDAIVATHTALSGAHHTLLHAAAQHNAAVLPGTANETLGAFYLDIDDIAVPANPGAGVRRLFVDTATGEISVRTSGGATVSLEGAGGGGERG